MKKKGKKRGKKKTADTQESLKPTPPEGCLALFLSLKQMTENGIAI